MKTIILNLSILLTFYGCELINDSSDSSNLIHKSTFSNSIEFSVDITKNNFSLYDTLFVLFKVKNNSVSVKEFKFSNIQQLTFQLIDKDNNVAIYYPYIVSPALSSFTIEPGETKELNVSSIFKDNGGKYINKGIYTLSVALADNNSPKLNLSISIY